MPSTDSQSLYIAFAAEMSGDHDRAKSIYSAVMNSPDYACRAAARRRSVALMDDGAEQRVEVLRAAADDARTHSGHAEAIADAEDSLVEALVGQQRAAEAVEILEASGLRAGSVSSAALRSRYASYLTAGSAAPNWLVQELQESLAGEAAGRDWVESTVVRALEILAASRRAPDPEERRLIQAMLETVAGSGTPCEQSSTKRLARSARQLADAGLHREAALCWLVIWIQRRAKYGASHEKTRAAHRRYLSERYPPVRMGRQLAHAALRKRRGEP